MSDLDKTAQEVWEKACSIGAGVPLIAAALTAAVEAAERQRDQALREIEIMKTETPEGYVTREDLTDAVEAERARTVAQLREWSRTVNGDANDRLAWAADRIASGEAQGKGE
jgi:hypothetical protein